MKPICDYGYRLDVPPHEERVEMHVLARAYRDAWLSMKGRPPQGRHQLASLGIAIEFEEPCRTH